MEQWQQHKCAICGRSGLSVQATVRRDALLVDHHQDSDIGYVRGLLCPRCNADEQFDGVALYQRYREHPPTAALGIQFVYLRGTMSGTWLRFGAAVPLLAMHTYPAADQE